MKKGELKKQEIMETAEILFCKKGYEQTSIQDILDKLKTSKGSFYHHFVSKEALLADICRKRASQIFDACRKSADGAASAAEKLNRFFSGMIPFREEKLSFFLMFLHIFDSQEGKSVRSAYCDALSEQFCKTISETISDGVAAGELYCSSPDFATEICLTLVNQLWVKICNEMILSESKGVEADLSEMLRLTEQYRYSIEAILTLQFGSLELIRLPELKLLNDQIHTHWNE